jgi:hypothetical protein
MPRAPSLSSMSVDALLKLRDDIGKVLSQKAVQLEDQLSKLGGEAGSGRRSSLKGQKVPVKYRDRSRSSQPSAQNAPDSLCEAAAVVTSRQFSAHHR